nr:hypothetical protein [Tanacetum cinerariifolium]
MIAILEKSEYNVDFHQIVDFVEASHIRYALTINPTVYVSHIRQFWSTARIEKTNEGTKILATVDEAGQDKENIIKTSALPRDLTPRVTSLDAYEGTQDLEISSLKARIKLLEDKNKGTTELSGDDAPIKGRSLETGEEAGVERSIERGSNDTEELVNVLTSMDAANILTSEV